MKLLYGWNNNMLFFVRKKSQVDIVDERLK